MGHDSFEYSLGIFTGTVIDNQDFETVAVLFHNGADRLGEFPVQLLIGMTTEISGAVEWSMATGTNPNEKLVFDRSP